MKKALFIIIILLAPFLFAWNDCTKGNIDDPCYYPGDCSQYIDTNNDGICDHSQPEPVIETTTTDTSLISSENSTSLTRVLTSTTTEKDVIVLNNKVDLSANDDRYQVKYVFTIPMGLYILSFSLIRERRERHRLWNYILLVFFLASSLTGVLLAIGIIPQLLWWHVETGIVMAAIAVIHTMWHSRYFFRRRKKRD